MSALDNLADMFRTRTEIVGKLMERNTFRESHAKQVEIASKEIEVLDMKLFQLERKISEAFKKLP
jgi:hypothetical protein